jgi:two-component system, NarL family, response regulator NreC
LPEQIRVALCDDHAVVRSGLRRILDDEPDITVVGEAGNAEDAVALATAEHPDVFVMDLGLPGTSGIDATRQVQAASAETAVLVLTVHDDVGYLRRAFDAGATGYLVKDAADVELVMAVRHVAAGDNYVHPSLGAALLEPEVVAARPSGPGGELSEREVEVLRLVALGHTNADIAQELYVSVRTVETHRAHVQQKLGVRSRAELVRITREHGLISEDPAS